MEGLDSSKLKEDFDQLSAKLKETEDKMTEQKELYESDKESWQNVKKGLQDEINSLTEKTALLSAQLREYSDNWRAIQEGPDEMKSSLASATIR
jgi:chromosome segregation ATPase